MSSGRGRAVACTIASASRSSSALGPTQRRPVKECSTFRNAVKRGVLADGAAAFLAPKLKDLLPDPLVLKDMALAAARFLTAVQSGEKIAVFADYDVDGGASTALLLVWLRQMGRDATLYIPDRIDEGYGPNEPAMAELAARHDLIVCVDCGTLSHAPIAAAVGADVIVLDHHLGAETLPAAYAVVNPNRQDESGLRLMYIWTKSRLAPDIPQISSTSTNRFPKMSQPLPPKRACHPMSSSFACLTAPAMKS